MKTKINLICAVLFISAFISCKKDNNKNSSSTTTPTTPTFTKGYLTNITIMSIPNSSTFYEANGADICWGFWANTNTGAPLIALTTPKVNVQDIQFPLVGNSTSYPVFLVGTSTYYIQVFNDNIITDGQSTNQYIGEVAFTWSELPSKVSLIGSQYTGNLTKTLNGTSIQISFTLE